METSKRRVSAAHSAIAVEERRGELEAFMHEDRIARCAGRRSWAGHQRSLGVKKSLKHAMGMLDQHLKPLGFERRGLVWLRRGGPAVGVIDLQQSSYGELRAVPRRGGGDDLARCRAMCGTD